MEEQKPYVERSLGCSERLSGAAEKHAESNALGCEAAIDLSRPSLAQGKRSVVAEPDDNLYLSQAKRSAASETGDILRYPSEKRSMLADPDDILRLPQEKRSMMAEPDDILRLPQEKRPVAVEQYDILRSVMLDDHKPVEPGSLPPGASLLELCKIGAIADRQVPSSESHDSRFAELGGAIQNGTGRMLFASNGAAFFTGDSSLKPDVLIKQDGTIELHSISETPPLLVQFEGTHGSQMQLTAVQEFLNWLQTRDELLQSDKVVSERLAEVNERFSQSGSMSGDEASKYFPPGEYSNSLSREDKTTAENAGHYATEPSVRSGSFHREVNDVPADLAAVLNMVSYMSGANNVKPYDTVRSGVYGYAVGRYGLTANMLTDLLGKGSGTADAAEKILEPKNISALMTELSAHHQIPGAFARQFNDPTFAREFCDFIAKLKNGKQALSRLEIEKYLPACLQEATMKAIATNACARNMDAATLSLAMHLGKPLSQLKPSDLSSLENQQYMYASQKVLGLALAAHEAGPHDKIGWHRSAVPHGVHTADHGQAVSERGKSNDGAGESNLAFSIARAAEHNARHTDTIGWCLRGVAQTLDRFGIHLYGGSAYEAAPQLAKNGHFKEVAPEELKKGTVLVFGPTHKHPHGHITVYLGAGKEASDHVQGLVNFQKYSSVRAFEPIA